MAPSRSGDGPAVVPQAEDLPGKRLMQVFGSFVGFCIDIPRTSFKVTRTACQRPLQQTHSQVWLFQAIAVIPALSFQSLPSVAC